MPTCRRKRVVLTEPSPSLLLAAKSDPTRQVYYLKQTGEIFETYDAYAARMSFYRLKQFQCDVTGKSGLDYFQALASEQTEARTMHTRFPEPLKPAILKAVQWQVMGRLDHLVEAVYERFKDRYFPGERVLVEICGSKYYAKIHNVYAPPPTRPQPQNSTNSASEFSDDESEPPIHPIGGDLKIPAKETAAKDDPARYDYTLQILEAEKEKGHEKGKASAKNPGKADFNGHFINVHCGVMSRDRLAFSKSILRRFIRDCVDRDAAVASPWTVKPGIAKRYGVDSVMPEETRKGVESLKKGEMDKRKKVWEDKDGPPAKKARKMTSAQDDKDEKKERETHDKFDKQREEAERLAAEKKKKKPIRYPTEDLDVRLSEKEKKAGMKVQRPIPSCSAIPFQDDSGTFESFLMTWNFLIVYGQPLHLSTFTLDEFEHAIRHSVNDPPCLLIAEIHASLIYNLRTVPFQRHSAVRSLLNVQDRMAYSHGPEDEDDEDQAFGINTQQLVDAMASVGNDWERFPLRASTGREGWEDTLVGCLKDHANLENFPSLRRILTWLLFAPDSAGGSPALFSEGSETQAHPIGESASVRYPSLPIPDKIAILFFMCNLAISSKAIHGHMEVCEEQLTALRKEKIEVNRQKKQYAEEMNTLLGEAKEAEKAPLNGTEDAVVMDSSDLSDISPSEVGSETPSSSGVVEKRSARQKDLRQKAQSQAHAKQREVARAKVASAKQALAEHRRLDEEVNKLERRLEGIEREFRKLLGGSRVKPIGKDRFFNRIWWFDGMGSASLLGSGGVVQYGTGRIFVQGPSEFDAEVLERRMDDELRNRRKEELGEDGLLKPDQWAVYSELEEVDEFVAWLNPKGNRELALKNTLNKWWPHIAPGIRKRLADINVNEKLTDARRSARTKAATGHDIYREPYMMWTNRRAISVIRTAKDST